MDACLLDKEEEQNLGAAVITEKRIPFFAIMVRISSQNVH